MTKYSVGDYVIHKNYENKGDGKIIFVNEYPVKKYTILFKDGFLKHCSEIFIEKVQRSPGEITFVQRYIIDENVQETETFRFYKNISDLALLQKIPSKKKKECVIHLENEIIMDIQEQICNKIVNPNILVKNKPIIQLFFELETMPLHIELWVLTFLLENSGGSDTIPPFKNGPFVFREILKKFKGLGLVLALDTFIQSGVNVEGIIWELMNSFYVHTICFEKDLSYPIIDKKHRDYILSIILKHTDHVQKNECSICFENIGYKITCCMRPESTNFICHDCYLVSRNCPFCRDPHGMLMNPEHEKLINNIFSI